MDDAHHSVCQPDGLPPQDLDYKLHQDHPEEVWGGLGHIARGGGQVWEGRVGRAGQVEHPPHALHTSKSSCQDRNWGTLTMSDVVFMMMYSELLLKLNCIILSHFYFGSSFLRTLNTSKTITF